MNENIHRRKLLNAVIYFASKVRKLNTTKLMKLLYYLDSVHFKQTGRPSIGLIYVAHKNGPLPVRFWKQVVSQSPPKDLSDSISICNLNTTDEFDESKQFNERLFSPKQVVKPDMRVFTPREIEIMDVGIDIFGPYDAKTASQATHERGTAWYMTIKSTGSRSVIDYMMLLKEKKGVEIAEEEAYENLLEFFSFMRNFDLQPT